MVGTNLAVSAKIVSFALNTIESHVRLFKAKITDVALVERHA
jgi:hypothetical protein